MNQLQVLKKLIPIYTEAINRIADGEETGLILILTKTGCGVYWCGYMNGLSLNRYQWDEMYSQPYDDYPNAIECLSYRLTIMQLMVMDITQK